MINVAISASWKVEDLNLLLEILKLNFKGPLRTFVFMNTSEETFQKCGNLIRRDLIDEFDWIPEKECYPGNTSRDTKRRQPLELFKRVVSRLRDFKEGFCFLEGDCFPMSEEHFLRPFERLSEVDIVASRFDFANVNPDEYVNLRHRQALLTTIPQMHKMPDGYIFPVSMWFSPTAADEINDLIAGSKAEMLDGTRNFEGMLGTLFKRSGVIREQLSDRFCFTYPTTNQLDPVTRIIHHHNVMNLRDSFVEYGIAKGEMVRKVLAEDSYVRAADGVVIQRDGTPVEMCELTIK